MHPKLLESTVQQCRDYIEAGDCHGEAPPVERLIEAVAQLAAPQGEQPAPAGVKTSGKFRTHCPWCGSPTSVADEAYCANADCRWNNGGTPPDDDDLAPLNPPASGVPGTVGGVTDGR